MSGVKTEWHLADLTPAEDDPFSTVVYSAGVTLDLTASEDELGKQLVGLLYREERLAKGGLTCSYKDKGQDCLTCPHATLEPEDDRSRLCRLGKDECTVERRFEEVNGARLAPLRELMAQIDSATELGALPDDLAELVGELVGP